MEMQRVRELILLGFRTQSTRLALVGGNHTAARSNTYLIIRLPHPRVMRLLARSVVLALFFASLPIIRTFLASSPSPLSIPVASPVPKPAAGSSGVFDVKLLSFLLHDLTREGLYETGNKAVFLSGTGEDVALYDSDHILKENNVDLISASDFDRQGKTPDESYDFAFSSGFDGDDDDEDDAQKFIDRALKLGGISVVQLSHGAPYYKFNAPSNYKVVYVRRLESTILAMKKTGYADNTNYVNTQRKLLSDHDTEERKAALSKLEDVLLEPPRAASGKSRTYLKKTRYLPDLLGDSLESYERRVFIDVGLPEKDGGSGTGWFAKHYPTRNLDFDMYKIETLPEGSSGKEVSTQVEKIGISDWLRKNVREDEYVVMKAEAEEVEEMMKTKAIRLVDELFMECKPSGHGRKMSGSKRAYWECLALYG
ncbi:hypothetical protein Tsubulata_008409, partial [Turnera subulata]